jgi:hypothetical protein
MFIASKNGEKWGAILRNKYSIPGVELTAGHSTL